MNLLFYVVPIFVALILLEVLAAKLMRRDVYRIHDAVTSMNVGIMSEVVRSTVKLLTVVIYAIVASKLGAFTWDVKNPWVWILAFFMYDFGYYWAHRAGHEVSLLWGAHVVHHNSEEFNLSTALRQSSTNTIFYWVFYAPMALVGIPVQVFVITAFASAVYQFWVHTQLIDRMGWMEKIFTTPSNHRVHHGKNEYCLDHNYGGTLIIWDRMFGTYAREREDEPVIYGTITPVNSWNPVWTNFVHYVSIVRNAFHFGGWKNKLQSVFAPPGWTPQGMLPHPAVDLRKFQTTCGPWQRAYCVLGCGVVYVLAMHWLAVANTLSVPERVTYGLVNVLATLGLSGLMSHQRLGVPLELARVVVVFGALAANFWFAPIAPAFQALAVLCLAVSAFLLYKVHVEQRQGSQSAGGDGGEVTGVPA
ncbi:MAG: sterol desaturase family protein [Alphaproteobacteria bacterium]|nr:sterol desaturase family protein [Alphaproteobacteria bacterium]